jgi:hypothetical protein
MSDVPIQVLEERVVNPKVARQVKIVCAKYPCARGDYRLLEKYVLRDFYGIPFGVFERVRRSPSGGTIDRRWREAFAEAKASFCLAVSQGDAVAAVEAREELLVLMPSEATLRKRMKNEKVWHDYYSMRARKQKALNDFEDAGLMA